MKLFAISLHIDTLQKPPNESVQIFELYFRKFFSLFVFKNVGVVSIARFFYRNLYIFGDF